MTYVGTLIGTDSASGNVQNLTLQYADVGAFAAGDLALFFWEHVQGAGGGDPPSEVTDPTGFTLEGYVNDNTCTLSLWSKVLDGTESGNITAGHAGATRHCVGVVVVRGYTGVHSVTGTADAGSNAVHTTPSATPSVADVGVLIASGERQNTGSSSATYPVGYTQALVASTSASPGGFLSVAYEGSAGSISGTHTASVAISPGDITHNVSSTDAPTLTVLLTPASTSLTRTASLAATDTITAAGQVGKAVGSSIAATSTVTTAGQVGKAVGASVSETATITAAGAVGKATGASISGTVSITAAGVVGKSSGASIAATGTISAAGSAAAVGATEATASLTASAVISAEGVVGLADGASISATASITAEGVVSEVEHFFEPPTVAQSATGDALFGRYTIPVGQSVLRVDGAFQTIPFPWMGELVGTEGTDWFLGGRRYPITAEVAAELNAAGYTTE